MKRNIIFLLLCAIFACFPVQAHAKIDIYTLRDEQGKKMTLYCGICETGDEYISEDNLHYRVESVNDLQKEAQAVYLGPADMPDVNWLEPQQSLPVISIGTKKIALYCTHSDESYIKGDGTESIEGHGGIYDIASVFSKELEKLGASVELSHTTHLPHDAGAYRRSRQTAVALLKKQPDAIFDIHRDGIPDPDEYSVTIGTDDMSMVRLLVGKSNQNKEANLGFAKQIKAVADKTYPGLIKDIYIGKGSYNQDLYPRSVLLEFGTHTLSKEMVLKSVPLLSQVVYKTLFGGIVGSAGGSDVNGKTTGDSSYSSENALPAVKDQTGSSRMIWLILALIIALGIFAFLSAGGRGGMQKWKQSLREMCGGLFSRKPPKHE